MTTHKTDHPDLRLESLLRYFSGEQTGSQQKIAHPDPNVEEMAQLSREKFRKASVLIPVIKPSDTSQYDQHRQKALGQHRAIPHKSRVCLTAKLLGWCPRWDEAVEAWDSTTGDGNEEEGENQRQVFELLLLLQRQKGYRCYKISSNYYLVNQSVAKPI